MSFNVSYVYRIMDRYSGPLHRITVRTRAFKEILKRTNTQMKSMSKHLETASRKMVNFKIALGAGGAVDALSSIVNAVNRFEDSLDKIQSSLKTTKEQMSELSNQALKFGQTMLSNASKAEKAAASFGRVSDRMRGMGQRMKSVSSKMVNFRTTLGAAGTGGALLYMINIANRFERSLNSVQAKTQATDEQMKLLRTQARELGQTTQFSASQAAEAMEFLGMAGLKVGQIMEAIPGMLDLAAAGNLDLASAADISTNILTAFGMEIEELVHMSDVLALSAAKSNTNIYQMAEVMKNVATTAKQAGVSFEETAAMSMILANAGIKGGDAGTQLMNAMRVLTNMAPKTIKRLAKLGIDPRKLLDSEGRIKDLTGVIDQLAKRGATIGDFFQIFDIRGAKAMATLKEQGTKKLSEFTEMLIKAENSASEMADIMMKGLPGSILLLKSMFEEIILMMMAELIPVLLKVIGAVVRFMRNLKENHPTLMRFVAWGALIIPVLAAVALAVGVVVGAIGGLISLVGAVPLAIGAGITALIALGAWLYKLGRFDVIIEGIKKEWHKLKLIFQFKIFQYIKEEFEDFFSWITDYWEIYNKIIDKAKSFLGFGDATITTEEAGVKAAAVQGAAREMAIGNIQSEMTGKIVISTEGGAKVEQAEIGPINTGANLVMVE